MPRSIEISLDPQDTDRVLGRLTQLEGVVGVAVQRGAGVQPPGDVISVQSSNNASREVLGLVQDLVPGASLHTSELAGVHAPAHAGVLAREENETSGLELGFLLRDAANPTWNFFGFMALSGVLAATGLWSNQLPYVLAAQLLGPHVEPLLRLPSGLVNGPREATGRGLLGVVLGYAVLALAAGLAYVLFRRLDPDTLSDLHARQLARGFAQLTSTNLVAESVAALAVGLIAASRRTILLSGVYVGLALLPSMALTGMALAGGQWSVARGALTRWTFDAAAVVVLGGLVLAYKQALVYRRRVT